MLTPEEKMQAEKVTEEFWKEIEAEAAKYEVTVDYYLCLLYTSPSPRDGLLSRMPSSA